MQRFQKEIQSCLKQSISYHFKIFSICLIKRLETPRFSKWLFPVAEVNLLNTSKHIRTLDFVEHGLMAQVRTFASLASDLWTRICHVHPWITSMFSSKWLNFDAFVECIRPFFHTAWVPWEGESWSPISEKTATWIKGSRESCRCFFSHHDSAPGTVDFCFSMSGINWNLGSWSSVGKSGGIGVSWCRSFQDVADYRLCGFALLLFLVSNRKTIQS